MKITSFAAIVVLVLLIVPSLAFAGFFDVLKDITGLVSFGNFTATVDVGNAAPFIANITLVTSPTLSPSEDTYTNVTVTVITNDTDGIANLQGTAFVNVSVSTLDDSSYTFQSTPRRNTSCSPSSQDLGLLSRNWTCVVYLWFFDPAAVWDVNVSVVDSNGAPNSSGIRFTYSSLTALKIGPSNLTWASLGVNTFNQTATRPVTLNNTGNKNITPGALTGVNLTAYNLTRQNGGDPATDIIPAENFSVSNIPTTNYACNLTGAAVNQTFQDSGRILGNASLLRGNYSNGLSIGQLNLTICLREVPATISSGRYATNTPWRIEVI